MKSLYIVFPGPNSVEVQEETIDSPASGQILCAAEQSLISIGTELHCLRGVFEPGTNWAGWVSYPFRPGYCMVARVISVGRDVQGIKEGDRVTFWGAHQQLHRIDAEQAVLVPEGISSEDAAWATLACTAQLGVRRAELKLGETTGVIGMGILGQLAVQYLALSGARKIIAIDPAEQRLRLAGSSGATHTLALDARSAQAEVERLTDGAMLDVAIDITGSPDVLGPGIQLLRRLGRLVLLGDTPTPSKQHLGPGVVSNSIAILGIHGSMYPAQATEFNPWTRKEMTTLFFDYLQQGRMRVNQLVSRRASPHDAIQIYRELLHDRSQLLGIIFDWASLG